MISKPAILWHAGRQISYIHKVKVPILERQLLGQNIEVVKRRVDIMLFKSAIQNAQYHR
jgi:hypothetical protein